MKIPTMPVSITEIGFILMCQFLILFLMALSYSGESLEKYIHDFDLTKATITGSSGVTSEDFLTVTIAQGTEDQPRIFVSGKETGFEGLRKRIKSKAPKELCLRVDSRVPHGQVMNVILMGRELGVSRASFAFGGLKGDRSSGE